MVNHTLPTWTSCKALYSRWAWTPCWQAAPTCCCDLLHPETQDMYDESAMGAENGTRFQCFHMFSPSNGNFPPQTVILIYITIKSDRMIINQWIWVPHSPLPQHSEAVFFLWLPLLGSFKPQITQICGRNAWHGAWKSMEFCNLLGSGNVCNIIGWKLKHCRTNSWYVIAWYIYIVFIS